MYQMVLSLNIVPNCHCVSSYSTSSLHSIQQLIFNLQHQVEEEMIAKNNCRKQELTTLQQILDTFTDPEFEEDGSDQKFKNAKQQQQQSQLINAESEASIENSNQTTFQLQLEHNSDPAKSIEEPEFVPTNQNTGSSFPIQIHPQSSHIREEDLHSMDFALKNSKIRSEQNSNSLTGDLLLSGGGNTDLDLRVTDLLAMVADEEDGKHTAAPELHRESPTVEGDDDVRSSAEAGASAEAKEEKAMVAASEPLTNPYKEAVTLTSEDLRTRGFRHGLTIVAKPPPLLAAVFPWDRGSGLVTVKKKGEAMATGLVSPSGGGLEEEIHSSGSGDGAGSLRHERAAGTNEIGGLSLAAAMAESEKDQVREKGWVSLQARPWMSMGREAPAVSRATRIDDGGVKEMLQRVLLLPTLRFRSDELEPYPYGLGFYSMGLTHFRMKQPNLSTIVQQHIFLHLRAKK